MTIKDLFDTYDGLLPVKLYYLENNRPKFVSYEATAIGYILLIRDHGDEKVDHWRIAHSSPERQRREINRELAFWIETKEVADWYRGEK